MDRLFAFVAMVTLSMVYVRKSTRSFNVLAAAQLRLAESHRRILAEELRAAQAAVDPAFLFGVLGEVDQRFEDNPVAARQLLDGLIRYLRAALPDTDEVIGTIGQQAALVRAWLDMEAIRSAGRVQGHVDVPAEVERRPFAPALILPLVALVARGHDGFERDMQLRVLARVEDGRLIVEVREDGSKRGPDIATSPTIDSLRHRLVALYGSGAELSLALTQPSGSRARIVIDDPGTT